MKKNIEMYKSHFALGNNVKAHWISSQCPKFYNMFHFGWLTNLSLNVLIEINII